MKKIIPLVGVLLAIILALVGCGTGPTASTPSADAGQGADAASVPAIGMLVGPSPTGHSPQWTRQRALDAQRIADMAGEKGARVVVDTFGSGPEASTVTFNERVVASGANKLMRDTRLRQTKEKLVEAASRQATSGRTSVDLISGVRALSRDLAVLPRDSRAPEVVISGSALQTAGGIDLRDFVQLADTQTTLDTVVQRGLLPDCTGWRVHLIGGAAGADGALDALREVQLQEFWRSFFERCGGTLVQWNQSSLVAFPGAGKVPKASWKDKQVALPLPAEVLFQGDQAALRPGGRRALDKVVALLTQTHPRASATITGHAATVGGSAATAMALSRARAETVADYLEAHGVAADRLKVISRGAEEPVASNDTEEGRQKNRRVIVMVNLRH